MSDKPEALHAECDALRSELATLRAQNYETQSLLAGAEAQCDALRDALTDMYGGWKYIRSFHGDLYGVGWDRCDEKARAAIAKAGGNDE